MIANKIWKITTIVAVVTLFGDLPSKTAYAGSSFLSVEEVKTLLTGKTEMWTKGAAYYSPDGKLLVLWEGQYSNGRWGVINGNSRGMLCYKVPIFGHAKDCNQHYRKSGDKITILWKQKRHPFKFLNGNQLAQLKSGVSYAQLKQRPGQDTARLLAKKKAEEEAARQLAKKKAEEEAAAQLAKKKAEEEAAKLAQAELKSKQEATAYAGSSFLSVEEVKTLLTGKTEMWTKGAAYYSPDGKLLVLWEGQYSNGRWGVINGNSRGMLCYKVPIFGHAKDCNQHYRKSGDKITILWKQKRHPFKFLNGNQLAQLKSGVSYAQLKQRPGQDTARLLAKKKAEEEAARQLAKKKAEEEAAAQLAKKKAEEEAAKLAQAELKSKQEATAGVDNSVEVEFWKSIKGDDDPDMFRAYLEEYPTGKFVKLAKLKIKKLGGGDTATVVKSSIPNLDYGDYYALVIGNNDYESFPDLRTAVNDARKVADLLKDDYDFNVTLLENADRSQIVKSVSGLRRKVSSKDNVLIYYAGHGYLDEAADEGFWLPVDASPDDPVNWIMTDSLVSQIRAMEAKHVMIVADSCFSGAITRGLKIEQRTPAWFEKMVKKKARTALTSGGLEPVMDSGSGGQHSIFAESFLSILRDNDGVLDASQLYSQLRPKVMVNSDQTPEYGDIHRAGHDGGDFLFVRQ